MAVEELIQGKIYEIVGLATKITFGIVIPASFLFMAVAFGAGLFQLWSAASALVTPWWFGWANSESLETGISIQSTIRALELFILAPLPYVVLHGLFRYLRRDVQNVHEAEESSGLLEVKAIVASILVSTVAVNLTGGVLDGDLLNWESAGIQLVTIVVLISYFVIMQIVAKKKASNFRQ